MLQKRTDTRGVGISITVYLEFFVITNFRVNFFRGSRVPTKIYLHKKVLHRNNFTLKSRHYFYMRMHVRSIKYTMAAAIEHVHRRACCVRAYHAYREMWEATVKVLHVRRSDGANCHFTHTLGELSRKRTRCYSHTVVW